MSEEENNEEEQDEEVDNLSIAFQCILNKKFTGMVTHLSDNKAEVKFKTTKDMAIDEEGLIHSAFIMSACEYAAIAVINKENIFMQSVEAEYLAPVEINTTCMIKAFIKYQGEKKKIVLVQAFTKGIKIFDGTFSLLELEQHILDIKLNEEME